MTANLGSGQKPKEIFIVGQDVDIRSPNTANIFTKLTRDLVELHAKTPGITVRGCPIHTTNFNKSGQRPRSNER